jgi:phosphomethylpyrimidine synthase
VRLGQDDEAQKEKGIGTSRDFPDVRSELEKVKVMLKYGGDTPMDLSMGGDLVRIRRRILAASPVPIGTVLIDQAAIKAMDRRGSIVRMTEEDLFVSIEFQAREGVDFMTAV